MIDRVRQKLLLQVSRPLDLFQEEVLVKLHSKKSSKYVVNKPLHVHCM